MPAPDQRIGDVIRSERQFNGWSRRKLAQKLGVSHSAVALWESNSTEPKLTMLIHICNLFGINTQSLLEQRKPNDSLELNGDETDLLAAWRQLQPEDRDFLIRTIRGLICRANYQNL